MRLDGKVVLITGAARGIGREAALMFAGEGGQVTATDVTWPSPGLDPRIDFVTLDVTNEEEWKDVVAGIVDSHGRIDVLVNNAGIAGSYDALDEVEMNAWDEVMAINLRGRHALPRLRRVELHGGRRPGHRRRARGAVRSWSPGGSR